MRTPLAVAVLSLLTFGCYPATQQPADRSGKIDVHVDHAPIHVALREVATAAKINLDADPDLSGEVTLDVHAMAWGEMLDQLAKEHHLRIEQNGPVLHVSNADKPAAPKQTLTGEPIAVDFDETPIRDVAKKFADHTGLTFTVDDDVQDTITLRLKALPWDLALDHLARKYSLKVIRTDGTVRIAKQ